jgi:putative PIN family toxin of toxin-antitoxin system
MKKSERFVIDTNVLVSAAIFPSSVPGQALDKAVRSGKLLMSTATFSELEKTLKKKKLRKYLSPASVNNFLEKLEFLIEIPDPLPELTVCRDPKDDIFLALAIGGKASCIITGDEDLLVLHPFKDIPIIAPSVFVNEY